MKRTLLRSIVLSVVLASSSALAAPAAKPAAGYHPSKITGSYERPFSAGFEGGFGLGTNSNVGVRVLAGIDFFYRLTPEVDVGTSLLFGGRQPMAANSSKGLTRWEYHFHYLMPEITEGFFVGATVGILDEFTFGPALGVNRPLNNPDFSWGVESRLVYITSNPGFASLDVLGNVRFHF